MISLTNRIKISLFDIMIYSIIIISIVVMVYPLLLLVSLSFSEPGAVMAGKVKLLPVGLNIANYEYVLKDDMILRAYFNTVFYSAVSLVLTLLFTSMAAYPLSLDRFRGKKLFTIFITVPMFITGGLIPYYLVVQKLGMINTVWAMVLPCVGTWNVIIFRIFFKENESLNDSAYIDGANDWVILFKIILPLSKPVLATIGLFTVVGQWNNFFGALLFLTDPNKHPIQMYIRKLLVEMQLSAKNPMAMGDIISRVTTRSVRAATIIATILPILFAYPFAQKYFVKGVRIGSIKG